MSLRIGAVENSISDPAVATRRSQLRQGVTKSLLFAAVLFELSMGRAGLAQSIDSVQITRRIAPSVVLITGTTDSGSVLGSGFVVSRDGEIATNLHVIQDLNAGGVRLSSGTEFDSFSILAFDEEKDLAIIKVAGSDLPAVALGNSDDVQVGEPVLIVGNPLGLQGSVSAGIISSLRDDPFGGRFKTLQTDAAVSPGNSGGPVVNRQQEVIGVVVYRIVGGENLNFAVPINYVRDLIASTGPAISLGELRIRLAKKGEGNAGPQSKPSLSPSPTQIPAWWYSADPKRVLADPLFVTLGLDQRTQILTQIDPKFAKLSYDKRHSYIWNAETDYLPKAGTPKTIFTWTASDPNCSSEFESSGSLKKIITANNIRVEATLKRGLSGFLVSHLRIVNNSDGTVQIAPQTFVLSVVKPKRFTLFFEYPSRVGFEDSGSWLNAIAVAHLDQKAAKFGWDEIAKVGPESLSAGPLRSNVAIVGNVWFEQSRAAREVLLRVYLSETEFDIPFTIQ
jgi:hypothetical protein